MDTSLLKVIICREFFRFFAEGHLCHEIFPSSNVTSLGKKISLFHVLSQNTHRKVEDLRQRICFLWLYAADDVRPPSQFY